MIADVQRELAEALEAATIDYGAGKSAPDVHLFDFYAAALLPTVQALIADAEKRAAAAHERIVSEATDLCWKATPFTEDETGAVAAYLLPSGVVHRLLGALQGAGYPAAFRAIAAPAALDPSGAAEGAGR